jgi:Tfp pilus assembly protein PilF
MRRVGPLLMSTVLVAGCASIATNTESLRVLLERSTQSQPRLSTYEQGKRHLQLGSVGRAVDAFQAALKENPDSVAALNGLAIGYERLGRADVAQRFLDRALTVDPESAVTLNNLAYLNLTQGNAAVAAAYAERAKIAAELPMEMELPETIAGAVRNNAQAASQFALSEMQGRRTTNIANLPPESDIKRVGLNEWELRIRPANPGDAVGINVPGADAVPRVTEPLGSRVTPVVIEPLADMAITAADIPEPVMDYLIAPPSLSSPSSEMAAAPYAVLNDQPSDMAAVPYAVLNDQPLERLPPLTPESPTEVAVVVSRIPQSVMDLLAEPIASASSTPDEQVRTQVSLSTAVPVDPAPQAIREVRPAASAAPTPLAEAIFSEAPSTPVPSAQSFPVSSQSELLIASLRASDPIPAIPSRTITAPSALPETRGVELRTAVDSARPPQRTGEIASAAPPLSPPVVLGTAPSVGSSATVAPSTASRLASPTLTPAAPQSAVPGLGSLVPRGTAVPYAPARTPFPVTSNWSAYVPAGTRVRVSNGTGAFLMAKRFARYFDQHGLSVSHVADANTFDFRRTTIFYNPEQRDYAIKLASMLPFSCSLIEAKQGRGQVELILGSDLLSVYDVLPHT